MKRAVVVTWMSVIVGGVVAHGVSACASSESESSQVPSAEEGGHATSDGGVVVESDATVVEDASGPVCSPDGWCATAVPDDALSFVSVWPLEGRAFATAKSPSVGYRVLEWSEATGKWTYIDDGSLNQPDKPFIGNIWASGDNDVYYAMPGGTIAHGTRPTPTEPWSWKYDVLPNHVALTTDTTLASVERVQDPVNQSNYTPTIGVWGTSAGDVYAWYTNTIFHRKSTGGAAPTWVAEYTADDISTVPYGNTALDVRVLAVGVTGTGPDDLWFSFVRMSPVNLVSKCSVVVRKTGATYERITDGTPVAASGLRNLCTEAPGYLLVGAPTLGVLSNLQPMGDGQVAGVLGGRELVKLSASGGSYQATRTPIMSLGLMKNGELPPTEAVQVNFTSAHAASPTSMWFAAEQIASTSSSTHEGNVLAVRGADVWAPDGGAYGISSLSLNGGPLEGRGPQIRGTSDTNLWLMSKNHALHKTK